MVVGTIVSLLLVDRVGRRPLLIEGGVQVQLPKPYLHNPDPSVFPQFSSCVSRMDVGA